EAVVGAIYLDQEMNVARAFVLSILAPELTSVPHEYPLMDPKSRLQKLTQADVGGAPVYDLVATTGPGHRPHFVVTVRLRDQTIGTGEGDNKQDAEQAAARMALDRLAKAGAPPNSC